MSRSTTGAFYETLDLAKALSGDVIFCSVVQNSLGTTCMGW
jgi:hypothetical protein